VSRGAGSRVQVRATVWFWPAVGVLGSFVVTLGLLTVRPAAQSPLARWTWPADMATSASLVQTVATAAMTAASLTFSLTVLALQLASQQFSPRLLREFARDRTIQLTMGVLISAFVVALTTLRGLEPRRPLPVLALLLTLVLGIAAGFLLLVFIGHLVRALRVDTMMARVHEDTRTSVEGSYPPYDDTSSESLGPELPGPEGGTLVPARRSGFVRSTDPGALVELARRQGVFLLLGLRPGDAVVVGSPVASAWSDDGTPVDVDGLADGLEAAVDLGPERTEEQDVAFGFRQLVDIAVKAISPAVNDPTTAAESLGYCADLLVLLQSRRLGPQVKRDDDGSPRVVLPDRDHRYYLDLACAQVRRFGSSEPTVLTALLRLLRDCAVSVRDDTQREALEHQLRLVLDAVPDGMQEDDVAAVHDVARRVCLALDGDADAAYRDRAGETRSI
jgi:uncharacterized membrane protein